MKEIEFVRCPLCNWWHVLHYALKAGKTRDSDLEKTFQFGFNPDAAQYQIREMEGKGRGSKEAVIRVIENRQLADLPIVIKENLKQELQAILNAL